MIQVKISASVAILAALLLSTLTTSCVKEPLSDFNETNVLTLSVTDLNGTAFRAATRTTNDGNIDNVVSTLRVFAFNAISGKKANDGVKVDVRGNTNPKVTMKLKEGEYIFVTVCNETVDLSPALDAVGFRDDLNSLSIGATNFDNTTAIPMVGETARMKVDEAGRVDDGTGKMVYQLTVKVERIAARMDFTVYSAKNDASADEKEVGKIKTLTLTGFPQNIGLMKNGSGYSRTEPGASVTLTGANFTTLPVTAMPDFSADEQAKYTYRAKLTGGRLIVPSHPHATGATPIVVNATFQGADLSYTTDLSGVISYTDGEVTKYAINRNTMYHTKMVGSPMAMRTETTFEDWTVGYVDGIVGKTYELSSNTKDLVIFHESSNGSPNYVNMTPKQLEQINMKLKVKFLVNKPPYTFRIVNEMLGIHMDTRMTENEQEIEISIDTDKAILENKNGYRNNDFWGFSVNFDYKPFYKKPIKSAVFRIEDIKIDVLNNGGIEVPSMEALFPECRVETDLTFIPVQIFNVVASGGNENSYWVTNVRRNALDNTNTMKPIPYIPAFSTIEEARTYCANLGNEGASLGRWHLLRKDDLPFALMDLFGYAYHDDFIGKHDYAWYDNLPGYPYIRSTVGNYFSGSSMVPMSYMHFPNTTDYDGTKPADVNPIALCVKEADLIIRPCEIRFTSPSVGYGKHLGSFMYTNRTHGAASRDLKVTLAVNISGGLPGYKFKIYRKRGDGAEEMIKEVTTSEHNTTHEFTLDGYPFSFEKFNLGEKFTYRIGDFSHSNLADPNYTFKGFYGDTYTFNTRNMAVTQIGGFDWQLEVGDGMLATYNEMENSTGTYFYSGSAKLQYIVDKWNSNPGQALCAKYGPGWRLPTAQEVRNHHDALRNATHLSGSYYTSTVYGYYLTAYTAYAGFRCYTHETPPDNMPLITSQGGGGATGKYLCVKPR